MLELLADHDDTLLEQLLMDETPEPQTIFADLAQGNVGQSRRVGAVRLGRRRIGRAAAAESAAPRSARARRHRQAAWTSPTPALFAFKISHGGTVGRLALARALGGEIAEGSDVKTRDGEAARLGALFSVQGEKTQKIAKAAQRRRRRGRQGRRAEGRRLDRRRQASAGARSRPSRRATCALAIEPADRKDDVKLSSALHRLLEEDATLSLEHDEASHEMRLKGVNDEHLNTVLARLERRYGVKVTSRAPTIGYRESVRHKVTQKGRHKKQSGGHGQFGDVIIELRPLPRGEGFKFEDKISGGAIPRQWIPAVEHGVKDAMAKGPLGLPGGRCRGDPDRRQLSQRRFLANCRSAWRAGSR